MNVHGGAFEDGAIVSTRKLSAAALVLLSIRTAALANDDAPPSDDTIVNTVQCEAGRAGSRLIGLGFPANLRAAVSWANTKVEVASGGVGFNFWNWGGSGDVSREQTNKTLSSGLSFNLHPKNLSVCNGYKKDIIQEGVGVYDCLINQKLGSLRAAIDGGTGSASCQYDLKISKKLNGDLKLEIWGIVGLGPSGSWGNTYEYNFVVVAPSNR